MPNRDNNPYDDLFASISKIVEEIVSNLPDHQNARIVGYTVITRGAREPPCMFRLGNNGQEEDDIPYEVVESDDTIYVTAELPPETRFAPFADIRINAVRICVDDLETTVDLERPVDVIHSYYRIHRGVMDIVLRKIPQQ